VTLTFRYSDAVCGKIQVLPSHLALEAKPDDDDVWRDSSGALDGSPPPDASSREGVEEEPEIVASRPTKKENPIFDLFDNVLPAEVLRFVDQPGPLSVSVS
jgi:hypothetical protein